MNTSELKFDEIVGMNNRDLESREIVVVFPYGRHVVYAEDGAGLGKCQEPRITNAKILKMRKKSSRRYGDLSLNIWIKVDDNPNIFKTYITKLDMAEPIYNRPELEVKVYEVK